MITQEQLFNDYYHLKKAAGVALNKKQFVKALDLLKLAATLAYTYNFIPEFADKEIEAALEEIAESSFETFNVDGREDVVVFYDYFGLDNRGLTQQYLRALIALKKRIVYILEHINPNFYSSDIYAELKDYEDVAVFQIKEGNQLEKVQEIIDILKKERPSKVLMHLAPGDVVAYMAFFLAKGIIRYQVNLTDHAFWLGVNITDVSLEFRAFGANLSIKRRGIDKEKIRIHPYYPIINNHPFEGGFPERIEGKKIIFAGGSIYKILGEKLIFLQLIQGILQRDPNLVFLFAGSGNTKAIKEFIALHNLDKQFFLLGDRRDLTAVVKRVDYFFTTFPFTGALTSQIAAACAKPIFALSFPDYTFNDLTELYFKEARLEEYETTDLFTKRFFEVYQNERLLDNYGTSLKESLITSTEYSETLESIFNGKNPLGHLNKDIDITMAQVTLSNYLVDSENKYNPQYYNIIKNGLPIRTRREIFPKYFRKEQRGNLQSNKIRFLKNIIKLVINR